MHHTLTRQIARRNVDPASLPENIQQLFSDISDTYTHADEDRAMIERSLELSSKELGALNAQLKESKERLLTAINSTDVMMVLISIEPDHVYRYVLVNQSFLAFSHQSESAVIGKTLDSTIPDPKMKDKIYSILESLVTDKKPVEFEIDVPFPDGTEHVLNYRVNPVINSTGEVTHAMSIAKDITEQKRAQDSLREHQTLLATAIKLANLGSWKWNLVTNTVVWSDELLHILGYTPGEITPTFDLFTQQLDPAERERILAEINHAVEIKEKYAMEQPVICKDGQKRIIFVEGHPIKNADQTITTYIGIVRDITEQKIAEQASLQRTQEMERLNKAMIGRELKMIELKQEIKRLKAQLELPT